MRACKKHAWSHNQTETLMFIIFIHSTEPHNVLIKTSSHLEVMGVQAVGAGSYSKVLRQDDR